MKTINLFLFVLSLSSFASEQFDIAWPTGKNAVAWRTKKRMFLVKSVEPVGISTDLKILVTPSNGGKTISAFIPIVSFDSQDKSRDEAVQKILKSDLQANLEFVSSVISESSWKDLFNGKLTSLNGELKIAGVVYPVKLNLSYANLNGVNWASGLIETKFAAFNIEQPSVVGGLVAKVSEELFLHVHLNLKDLLPYSK